VAKFEKHSKTKFVRSCEYPIGNGFLPTVPAFSATTILFDQPDLVPPIDDTSLLNASNKGEIHYGGIDTPTTHVLSSAVSKIEGGKRAILLPSGQAAICCLLLSLLSKEHHALVCKYITYTTKWLVEHLQLRVGFELEYFDSLQGNEIAHKLQDNTGLVFLESPGAVTYVVSDVPGITNVTRRHGITTALDNTWAASQFFAPFEKDVDISILSLTKYHCGPSGVTLGAVVTSNDEIFERVKKASALLGYNVSSDACARAAGCLPTLAVRMGAQSATATEVLDLLTRHQKIDCVVHPSLETCAGHAFWRRDFSGSNSLISFQVHGGPAARSKFLNALKLVRFGHGWGGLHSVAAVLQAPNYGEPHIAEDEFIRLYIGLEDPADLIDDIKYALTRI